MLNPSPQSSINYLDVEIKPMTQRSVTKDFTAVPSQVTIWGRHLSGTATPPYLGRHEQNPTNLLKKKGKNRLFRSDQGFHRRPVAGDHLGPTPLGHRDSPVPGAA